MPNNLRRTDDLSGSRASALKRIALCLFLSTALLAQLPALAQTVAAWPFDEQVGIYPSCVINDVSDSDYPMVIGPGGRIVPGKFGNALEPVEQPQADYPSFGSVNIGLAKPLNQGGGKAEPLTWHNANFAALITAGENHLRKEVRFANPTATRLNLGAFDWTVEFWFQATRVSVSSGVVFEIGRGPRGNNDEITTLVLDSGNGGFTLVNQPSGTRLHIPSDRKALQPESSAWRHLAFTYSASDRQLRHYVDGSLQKLPPKASLKEVPAGEEAYFSVGRDGVWNNPLPGKIDELRFSEGVIYGASFVPPGSFSPLRADSCGTALQQGPPLLFAGDSSPGLPVQLGDRKHLFIDGAIIEKMEAISFTVNPARLEECVIDNIQGPFRKHLNVVEDEEGNIRIYHGIRDDFLGVQVSRDGIRFEAPKLRDAPSGLPPNTVIREQTAMGMVFVDPNAPPDQRWKYLSDYHRQGIYLYSSPDGFSFKRHPIAVLPFRSGSQSNIFYDDQRQLYVSYHRTDFPATPSGKTQREFVRTETRDLVVPWPFRSQTQAEIKEISRSRPLKDMSPWYLDNGPLTPGGFGVEYPTAFGPDPRIDPVGADVYVPKALKYPWAPDAYLAFPLLYFHYDSEGTRARKTLGDEARGLGSGPVETQVAVSRDGIHWKRYPRPAYVGIGRHGADPIHQAYMAQGMVKRGNEIWQYYFGEEAYHSSWKRNTKRAVYRVSQRLDGFVSADSPYDRESSITTRPLIFKGNRLVLNIDTDAAGYAQVGFLDEDGVPVPGFSLDECIYVNGDFIETEVEWLSRGKDVSSLQGRTVRLVFRLRGTKLYALQFRNAD
jgi:hypothetical protein